MDATLPPLPLGATLDQSSTPPLPSGATLDTPKLPDLSGVHQMVQDNLAANDNKETPEGGEPKPPPSPMQRLETGTGLPVQKIISGSAQPSDVNSQNRTQYVNAIKDGSATNGSDWMQSYFFGVGNAVQQGGERYLGQVAYPFLSDENRQKLVDSGIVPPDGGTPLPLNAALSARILHGISEGISPISTPVGAYWTLPAAYLSPLINPAVEKTSQALPSPYASIPSDALNILTTALGATGAHYSEPIVRAAADKLGAEPQTVTPQQADQVISEGAKNLFPAAQDFHDVASVISKENNLPSPFSYGDYRISSASAKDMDIGSDRPGRFVYEVKHTDGTSKGFIDIDSIKDGNARIGDMVINSSKEAGSTIGIKNIRGLLQQIQEAHPEITSFSGDRVSGIRFGGDHGFSGSGVEISQAIGKNADLVNALHQIYEETGVHPDKVYEDAQHNPSIKSDILAGKVPEAYDILRDKRPPIPEDVKGMMDKMDELSKNPKPDLSKEGASESNNPLAKIFNPAGMSDASRDMATALRQGRGPENQDIAVIQDSLKKYAKPFAKMSDEDHLKFIDYMENRSKGAKLDNPELQEVADKIKDIYGQVGDKIQERFPDVGLRKDYFTHQYSDEAAAQKFYSDWVAKQGTERNLQARAFPTLSEAMEAGLKPKTTNPIETVMNYVNNMGNLMAAHRSVELAREGGIADYFHKGEEPAGWVPLDGNLAEKDGKTLYAPEDAARVYNNDVSKGFTGPAGDIIDNIQRVNNFANKLVLGLSGYHFTATTMASMASDVGRAISEGDVSDAGRAVTPLANTLRGQKLIDAYLGRSDLSPELQKAMDLAVKNNTVNVKQQDYWKAGPAKDYVDVFKNGSAAQELKTAGETIKQQPIVGPVKVIANEIGRTMDTIAKPLFDYYIPRIKITANIDELHDWLQNHPDATPEMQDKAAQDIGNSIDNRFGEMMRDNLFWHAITKQTLQTTLLSYSWVTGAARMLKGIPDTAQFIMRQKELSSSARYLMGMAATYAAVNGVRTYIGTGQAPNNIMDFIYPRTGGTTPQGKEERELLPSHIGQFTNYLHDGIGELGNEVSPGLKLIYHLIENKDWRGLPITNDNNKWYAEQRWDDYLKYTIGEETPIGLKNFLQGNKIGSKIGVMEKLLGARQAPRFITDPEGYDSMMKHVNDEEYKKKEHSDKKMQAQFEGNP